MTRSWPWPDFTPDEMRCRCGCGQVIVSDQFMDALQRLRTALGRPMRLTSACRCVAHNQLVGGHPRSLHICDAPQHPGQEGCLAVDVATSDGAYRGQLFSLAWQAGWSIGIHPKFLHLDRRSDLGLPQNSFDY